MKAPPPPDRHPWIFPLLAAVLPVVFLFVLPPLTKAGLWDPYELTVADLGRRVALNLFSCGSCALVGADGSLPHLNDLGHLQLPITSIALGFKVFGLHVWAGRAPLALWGIAGVLATYAFVARLVDRRAGLYAAVALTTMPLFFVQARTMLGDSVTMAALAMAFGGLSVAVFDRGASAPVKPAARLPWLAMAAVGLVSGFESRGASIGLGIPLSAVGLAWILSRAAGEKGDRLSDLLGGACLALGVFVVGMATLALHVESSATPTDKLLPLVSWGQGKPGDLNYWIGTVLKTQSKYPTFDFTIGNLGPALAPWSAFAPFAVGRLFVAPRAPSDAAGEKESLARMAILLGISVALAMHAMLAIKTDLMAFSAPALVAAACAVAIRDYERGAHPSMAVGIGTVVFLALLHHDFHELPEKAYDAFAITGATFPESFKDHALALWTVVLVGFAGVAFLTWAERDAARTPFDPKGYARLLRTLREAYDGMLALSFYALVAGASLAGLVIVLGQRIHARAISAISMQIREGVLNSWWATAIVPLLVIFGLYFASDVWLWAFGQARPFGIASLTRGFEPFEELYARLLPRGVDPLGDTAPEDGRRSIRPPGPQGPVAPLTREERWVGLGVVAPFMLLAVPAMVGVPLVLLKVKLALVLAFAVPSGVVAFLYLGAIGDLLKGSRAAFFALNAVVMGFVLCFSYYPALANQVSPKEVFETYEHVHEKGEPIALFGVGGRSTAYYAGEEPTMLLDLNGAYDWLTGGGGARRFLALKAEELPKLNQMYRERSEPRQNLPVVDARSSQIVLAASKLGGLRNENPLDKVVLSAPPRPQHVLDVNLEDKLLVLGYDLVDSSGHATTSIVPTRKYRLRTYYKVLAPVTTEWEVFVHLDGPKRHNGDHKPMDGKYPLSLWLKDDVLVDDYELSLEPNNAPGPYELYFGLYVGDARLKVKSGPSDGDNRIKGGVLNVQ